MSTSEILLLGAIAGFTIFLGLPIGRVRNPAPRLRALLNATAIGILLFLLWDVLTEAQQRVLDDNQRPDPGPGGFPGGPEGPGGPPPMGPEPGGE